MRKIFGLVCLILLVSLIFGCKPQKEEPKLEVEVAEEDISSDISEIDTLEEDLDMSELDELDNLINELG